MKPHALCIVESIENLGDAFIALAESEHLSRSGRYPGGVVVATWRPAGAEVTSDLTRGGVCVAPIAPNPWRFLRRCIGADVFIGGGNMLRPDVSTAWLLGVTAGCAVARLTGGRVSVVGAGAVAMPADRRHMLWSGLLALASRIQLREEQSAALTRRDHPRAARAVSVTGDAAFVSPSSAAPALLAEGTCLFAPGHDPAAARTVDADLVVEIVRALIGQGRLRRVLVVAHDPRAGLDGDACEQLGARLRREFAVEVSVVLPRGTRELLGLYATASVVVTNRLHSLIVAALHGLPVLCLHDATDKLVPFARALGYPGTASTWTPTSRADVAALVGGLNHFDSQALGCAVARCRESALRNFAH